MMTRFFFVIGLVTVLLIVAGCHSLLENANNLFSQGETEDTEVSWGQTGQADEWTPPIFSMSFSPDGERLAIGGFVGLQAYFDDSRSSPHFSAPAISLWQRDPASLLGNDYFKRAGFRPPEYNALAYVQVSQDGRRFAAAYGKGVTVYDIKNGTPLNRSTAPVDTGIDVISPDCRTAVCVQSVYDSDQPDLVLIININSGDIVSTYDLNRQKLRPLAISPDSRWLLIDQRRREANAEWSNLLFLDLKSGEVAQQISHIPGVRTYSSPRFTKDSTRFVIACNPDTEATAMNTRAINVWDIESGQRIRYWTLPDECFIWSIDVSSDGRYVAAGVEHKEPARGEIHVWDLSNGEKFAEWSVDEAEAITCVKFTPDAKTLAAGRLDGRIMFYQVPDNKSSADERKTWSTSIAH